eukprot:IDg13473t1
MKATRTVYQMDIVRKYPLICSIISVVQQILSFRTIASTVKFDLKTAQKVGWQEDGSR